MVRAIFFAIGLFVAVCGGSLLKIDEVVLNASEDARQQPGFRGMFAMPYQQVQKRVQAPQWAPFTLLSVGSVTMLYAVMLKRQKSED